MISADRRRSSPVKPRSAAAIARRPYRRQAAGEVDAAADERVIAEIAHELGNYFHKLYYWAEFLQEKRAASRADATAAQMLELHRRATSRSSSRQRSSTSARCGSPRRRHAGARRGRWHGRAARAQPAWLAGARRPTPALAASASCAGRSGAAVAVFQAIGRHLTEQAPAADRRRTSAIVERRRPLEVGVPRRGRLRRHRSSRRGVACLEWALAETVVPGTAGGSRSSDGAEGSTRARARVPLVSIAEGSLQNGNAHSHRRRRPLHLPAARGALHLAAVRWSSSAATRPRRCACSASTSSRWRSSTSRSPAPTASGSRARSATAGPTSTSS